MLIPLPALRTAAVRLHTVLATKTRELDARHERDLADAVASKSAVSSALAKERHAVRLRLEATAGVIAAIDEVSAETTSNPGAF